MGGRNLKRCQMVRFKKKQTLKEKDLLVKSIVQKSSTCQTTVAMMTTLPYPSCPLSSTWEVGPSWELGLPCQSYLLSSPSEVSPSCLSHPFSSPSEVSDESLLQSDMHASGSNLVGHLQLLVNFSPVRWRLK